MSPGLLAEGPGRFSARGVTVTKLILRRWYDERNWNKGNGTYGILSLAMASVEDTTVAAPPGHYQRISIQ
jgi:hypothetical protein